MVRYYTAGHPMLVGRVTDDAAGDPARGPWKPNSLKVKPKSKR